MSQKIQLAELMRGAMIHTRYVYPLIQAEEVVTKQQFGDYSCVLVCGKPTFKKFLHPTLIEEKNIYPAVFKMQNA